MPAPLAETAPEKSPPPSPEYARYVLSVLFVVYVFNFIDRQILSILVEPIKAELGVSDKAMGFLGGFAFALFYTFAGIPLAAWADRGTRRSIIALGLLVWSLLTAASGFARNFLELALARVGVGVGEAAASPASHSLISDYFPPEQRARALGIYTMGASIGIFFAFTLGGWVAANLGWRSAFLLVGLPGVLLAAVVRLTIREPLRGLAEGRVDTSETYRFGEVLRHMWSLRSFRQLCLATSLFAFSGYGFTYWLSAFLMRVHGVGLAEAGFWLGPVIGFGGAAGSYLGGYLADRLGARDARWYMWIPALGAIVQIPFAILFLTADSHEIAMLFLLPAAMVGLFYVGPTFSMTQGLAKLRMRALAAAILLFVINLIGLGLGPTVIGILSDAFTPHFGSTSLRYALLAIVGTNIWAAAHSLAAARTLRQDLERAT